MFQDPWNLLIYSLILPLKSSFLSFNFSLLHNYIRKMADTIFQLTQLLEILPELIKEVEYSELYGYDLNELSATETGVVIRDRLLTKFLVANKFDLEDAVDQLKKTLIWRKEFNPLSAGFLESHDEKLKELGIITSVPIPQEPKEEEPVESDNKETEETATEDTKELPAVPLEEPESKGNLIMTWNIYTDFKSKQEGVSDFDAFIRWRVGAMERGIALLDFTNIETSYMAQLHDYNKVSILRMDAATKEATKATIDLFQSYYPEILNVQYVVNIPTVMQWVFNFVKLFIAKQTFEKFRVISNGNDLAKTTGDWVPNKYGGSAETLDAIEVKEINAHNPQLITLYVPVEVQVEEKVKAEEGVDIPPEIHVPFAEGAATSAATVTAESPQPAATVV